MSIALKYDPEKHLYFNDVDKDGIKKVRGLFSWEWEWDKAVEHYRYWEKEASDRHKKALDALNKICDKRFVWFRLKKLSLLKVREYDSWWAHVLSQDALYMAEGRLNESLKNSS